jgi:ketosteroid isomerase-like protein
MSQENVKAMHRLIDAWKAGDRDAWLALSHPDIEWSSGIIRQVEGGDAVIRGRAEVGQFWDDWRALWDLDVEVSEFRDLGDTVLVLAQLRTRGKSSGAEVERSVGYIIEFEDGLIRRARAYLRPEEALQAAGLSE